jgi:hypothetical protein
MFSNQVAFEYSGVEIFGTTNLKELQISSQKRAVCFYGLVNVIARPNAGL